MIPRKTGLSLLAGTLVILSAVGCVSPFSKEIRQRVNKEINFQALLADPNSCRGQVVMIGGRILETAPKEGRTELTVLQQPLGIDYAPSSGDEYGGRFLLIVQGFLDPAVYSPGRKITAAAEVGGSEARPLGEKSYVYPVLKALELKLWPPPPTVYQYPFQDPFWGPPWGPFWWPPPPTRRHP